MVLTSISPRELLRRELSVILGALTLCWISRYWLCSSFGLYEDDYWRVPLAMSRHGWEIPRAFAHEFLIFKQGRPLHGALIGFFASAGTWLHGLTGMYWVGYCISVINALLLYALLRRVEAGRALAAAAMAAFAVYPADASQAFLTHALGVQPSLAMVLLAGHLWLSGRRFPAAAMASLALLCYETTFPLFAAVPLLLPKWNARQIARHMALAGGILAVAAVLRRLFGEERLVGLNLWQTAGMALHQTVTGPAISLASYIWRPLQTMPDFSVAGILAGLAAAAVAIPLCASREFPKPERLGRLAAAGFALLLLGYALAITIPATELDGRASRVHYAASAGCAILLGCLFVWLARRVNRKVILTAFAVLLGFATLGDYAVQRDYARSWNYQRALWHDIVRLCPDLYPGTVVLLEDSGALPAVRHLRVIDWNFASILKSTYWFRGQEGREPSVFAAKPGWQKLRDSEGAVTIDQNSVLWALPWEPPRPVRAADLIILDVEDGRLVRRSPPREPAVLTKGLLFPYLVGQF